MHSNQERTDEVWLEWSPLHTKEPLSSAQMRVWKRFHSINRFLPKERGIPTDFLGIRNWPLQKVWKGLEAWLLMSVEMTKMEWKTDLFCQYDVYFHFSCLYFTVFKWKIDLYSSRHALSCKILFHTAWHHCSVFTYIIIIIIATLFHVSQSILRLRNTRQNVLKKASCVQFLPSLELIKPNVISFHTISWKE